MKSTRRVRERVASAEELQEDRRRCLAAKSKQPAPAPAPKPETTAGNLCGALVLLARWRKCCVCGSETLFTDERGRSDADFECGLCIKVREDLAKRLRYVSLAGRVRPHLTSLFTSTANDNHEARA